jgi:FG-GAP repeat protein
MRLILLFVSIVLFAEGSAAQAADPFVLLHEIPSSPSYTPIGFVVTGGGDFDGDGFEDFAIGSPFRSLGVGSARVYSGIAGIPLAEYSGDPAFNIPPPGCPPGGGCGERFGTAILLMDLDGDSVSEFIAGAPGGWTVFGGTLIAVGRLVVFDYGSPPLTYFPPVAGSQFGEVLAHGGDLDADGFEDLLVSSPGYDIPGAGFGNTGAAWALAGPSLGAVLQFVSGVQAGENFGGTSLDGGLAGLGDVDGDGHGDWAVASIKRYNGPLFAAGMVRVVSGASASVLQQWQGTGQYQNLGKKLVALGDVDGDGVGDLAFCDVPIPALGNPSPTTLYVASGATGSLLYTWSSPADLGFVIDLGRVLDVTGDGKDEILLSHVTGASPVPTLLRVSVLSGANGALLYQLTDSTLTNFGYEASGAGDLNGDGLGDFLFSWQWAPIAGSSLTGKVLVYAARNLSIVGSPTVGGSLALSLNVPKWPNRPFVLAFSLGNTGFLLGPYWVPLTPDSLFLSTLEAGLGGILTSSGQASFTVPIPNDPSLHGTTAYASGGVFETAPVLTIRSILTATTVSIP